MALSHALPAEPFAAPRHKGGRRPLSFAPPREVVESPPVGIAPTRAGNRRERRLILALVALAHLAAIAGIARLVPKPTPVPETPISVALIELPVPIPPVAVPTPPTPPAPKPVVKPQPTPKLRAPQPSPAPAPEVESASAISADAVPHPPQEAPREAPASPPPAPARAAPEAPAPIVAARFDAAYLNNPAPAYPPLSRRMREEGKVLLRVQVTAEGLPGKVELAESSGFSRLDTSARESVLRWRFVPAKQEGRAVEAWVIVPIVFKLEGQ